MTDSEIIERAKATFVLDTPTERLARGVAERYADTEAIRKAGDELREEMECTSEECMCAGWLYSLEHILLDAFGGSGSTAQAALELGRSAISIELDERWCRKQADRVKQRSLF